MALRHWVVVLLVVPAIAAGSLLAIQTSDARRVLGLGPRTEIMAMEVMVAGAAVAALLALLYALAVRGGTVRGVFAASASCALTFVAFFGWLFAGLMIWALALCEPGAHDMCLRR